MHILFTSVTLALHKVVTHIFDLIGGDLRLMQFELKIFAVMVVATTQVQMLLVVVLLGIGKGIRSVYMSIVIPSYVPIDRLASASALQLFLNGIVTLCLGPVSGKLAIYITKFVFILDGSILIYFVSIRRTN